MNTMNRNADEPQRWSTSSFGSPADTSPIELAALGEHMNRCEGQRGALFALKCSADSLNSFMAPRLITILVLLAIGGAVASLLV